MSAQSIIVRVLVLPAAPLRTLKLLVVCKSCVCISNYCSVTGVNLRQNILWLKTWNLRIYVFMHVSRDLPRTDSTLVLSRTVEDSDASEVQCQFTLIWKGCNFVLGLLCNANQGNVKHDEGCSVQKCIPDLNPNVNADILYCNLAKASLKMSWTKWHHVNPLFFHIFQQ